MLKGVPFTRLLLAFVAGVLVEIWLHPDLKYTLLLFCASALIFSVFIFFPAAVKFRSQFISGVALSITIFTCGLLVTYFSTVSNRADYFAKSEPAELYLGKVDEEMLLKPNSYKSILKIEAVKINGEWENASGKVLVYFKKTDEGIFLNYGDKIVFNRKPVEVAEPTNPKQFNYKRYLSFHNTYHQVFLDESDYVTVGAIESFSLFALSYELRNKLLNILQEYIHSPRENAVVSALVLGYGEAIDQDLMDAYSGAGAMHVLCVSGLHVGIIYIVLSRLLVFLDKKKWLKILKFILLIVFIWFYALITGLSPSVSRAATMITLVILGTWIRGGTGNIYNTLIVSIFVLLFINPYFITEVGFQLSYLAVFGIIYVHPKIYALFASSSILWNRVWEITSVSISAQLATFPLAALYFHKFPNLFFVSNLFVIPLATIIIYSAIVLMLVSWAPFAAGIIAKLLASVIWFLNEIVLLIEKVPYSVVDGIAWSVTETWLVYALIIFSILFFIQKVPLYMQGAQVAIIALLVISTYKSSYISKQNKLIVYDINKTTAVDIISGNTNYLLADSKLLNDKNSIRFNILQNWYWMGAIKNNLIDINLIPTNPKNEIIHWVNNDFILFQNKRIAIKDTELESVIVAENKIKLDLLILKYSEKFDIDQIVGNYDVSQIVLDSTWPKWKANKVKEQLLTENINIHSVVTDKAFEWEL